MEELILGELTERKIGYGIVQPGESTIGGVPVIKVNNIISGLKSIQDLDTTHPENDQKYRKTRLNGGEIIISVVGTIGKTAIVPMDFKGCNLVRATALIDIKDPILSRWVKYYIDSPKGQSYINGNLNTTVQPTLNIKSLVEMPIPFYGREYAEKVVAILSKIDDKIENNRQINDNLEQQILTLYKAWFIDLLPFNGIRPSSWSTGLLSDLLNLQKDTIKPTDVNGMPYLPIDTIPMRSLSINGFAPSEDALSSLQKFGFNDIVIGAMRVYFHRVIIAPCDGVTRNTCFVLRPHIPNTLAYSLCICNQKDTIDFAQATSKGTTMPYAVWEGGLANMPITIPDKTTLYEFETLVMPLISSVRDSYIERIQLEGIRNSLLPKLMSGELKINEIDC